MLCRQWMGIQETRYVYIIYSLKYQLFSPKYTTCIVMLLKSNTHEAKIVIHKGKSGCHGDRGSAMAIEAEPCPSPRKSLSAPAHRLNCYCKECVTNTGT